MFMEQDIVQQKTTYRFQVNQPLSNAYTSGFVFFSGEKLTFKLMPNVRDLNFVFAGLWYQLGRK
jgi:hypothetical protein